jgi:GTP-binding protein
MQINTAVFEVSNSDVLKCPKEFIPEYAFIGRSNVGKSSLINMITNNKKLAKTSGTPGKTQLINHFRINNNWYLVDLPGYGYARVSKKTKKTFQSFIKNYFLKREQLICSFILIDCRLEPQRIDMDFMQFMGESEIPLSLQKQTKFHLRFWLKILKTTKRYYLKILGKISLIILSLLLLQKRVERNY